MKLRTTRAWLCASVAMVSLGGCNDAPGRTGAEMETEGGDGVDGGGDDDGSSDGGDGVGLQGPGECVEAQSFFRDEVWSPFMSTQCFACHNPLGEARHTDLVLQAADVPGYAEANLTAVRNVARLEIDGESLLLLKPLGKVEHGGGMQVEEGDDRHQALAELVDLLGEGPVTCSEDADVGAFFKGVTMMDDGAILRRAALVLASRLPTGEESAAVAIHGRPALLTALREMMTEGAFYNRLYEFFNQTLLTDKYLGGTAALNLLSTEDFPNKNWFNALPEAQIATARSRTNTAIAREPLELIRYLVEHDLPLTYLVDAPYTVANGYLARTYGADTSIFDNVDDVNEWRPIAIPDYPHAGLLTTPAYLNRYPTTATNVNRMRAAVTLDFFLATDVMRLGARPISSDSSTEHNPTMDNPECTSCHEILDPVAGAFKNWDDTGRYKQINWHTDMRAPGLGDEVMPSENHPAALQWLGNKIADDVRFPRAMLEMMYEGITGNEALQEPTDPGAVDYAAQIKAFQVQDKIFKEIAEKFAASNFDTRELIIQIVISPYFRASNVEPIDEQRGYELAGVGALRLASPEQLHRRIAAVTGYTWTDDAGASLLPRNRPLHLMYGGINSDSVTEPFEDVNGVMINISRRMANEMACKATAQDFARPSGERILFPFVDVDAIPGLDDEAIRDNVRHLHQRILGEVLRDDDPLLDDTVELFTAIYEDGLSGMTAGEYPTTLIGPCQVPGDPADPMSIEFVEDPDYTIRAWTAVVTAMLGDFRFIYE